MIYSESRYTTGSLFEVPINEKTDSTRIDRTVTQTYSGKTRVPTFGSIHYTEPVLAVTLPHVTSSVPPSRGAGLKYDAGKLRYSLIPPSATKAIAEVLTFGAAKYAPNSWQTVENAEERYLDALIRHLEAYRSGERLDPESGLPHIAHLLCNAAFLSYFDSKEPHGS